METSLRGTIHEGERGSHEDICGKSILSRRNSQHKGFEKWAHFSNSEETRVPGEE